jgi:holin-like protein
MEHSGSKFTPAVMPAHGSVPMKYLSQFLIILGFSFLGEVLQRLIPLPIPASIYGLILLFAALCLKLIRVEQVADAGAFLRSILPMLFVGPAVSILENYGLIADRIGSIALVLVVTTVLTFGITGLVTKCFSKGGGKDD